MNSDMMEMIAVAVAAAMAERFQVQEKFRSFFHLIQCNSESVLQVS